MLKDKEGVLNSFRRSWLLKGASYVAKPAKLVLLIAEVTQRLNINALRDVKDRLILLLNYLRDIVSGRYKGYSKSSLALAVAGLVYLVSVADLVPDFFAVVGWSDDLTVLGFVLAKLSSELENYEQFMTSEIDTLVDIDKRVLD